jgi:NAD(P)-dependent dehydrogenase (short-subunit alcohol dehydrogenase family)
MASRPTIHKANEEPKGYRYTTNQVLDKLPESASVANKVFIVTGAHSGLGEETARALSAYGAKVIVATRSESSAQAAIDRIKKAHPKANLQWLNLDLSDLDKVQEFATEFHKTGLPLHGLICNAGIMAHPYSKTKQGFESQFGVNHMGHFQLIKLLLDDLINSGPGSRVVVVSSAGYRFSGVRFDDLDFKNGQVYDPFVAYGQSKTANILCARTFNEKYSDKGVEFFSLHPGKLITVAAVRNKKKRKKGQLLNCFCLGMIRTNLGKGMSEDAKKTMITNITNNAVQRKILGWLTSLESFFEPVFGKISPKWMKTIEQGAATQVWAATSPDLNGKGGAFLDNCHVSEPNTEEAKDTTGENGRRLYDLSMDAVSKYL